MRKQACFLLPIVILAASVLSTTCNQDPIFYAIFQEVSLIEARIKGTPSNMVIFQRAGSSKALYVASDKIHWYANNGSLASREWWWDGLNGYVPQPDGKVLSLAATSTYLYALCLDAKDMSTTLRRISTNGGFWETIIYSHGKYRLQSVFASGPLHNERVFAGAADSTQTNDTIPCEILYLDGATLVPFITGADALNGVAFDGNAHFLSAKSRLSDTVGNIYCIVDSSFPAYTQLPLKNASFVSAPFMNIISLENSATPDIMAIDRKGRLYSVSQTEVTYFLKQTDDDSAGALALWRNVTDYTGKPALLLASIQASRVNGYRELDLIWHDDDTLNKELSFFREPGTAPNTTIKDFNTDRYKSTIGNYPVYHLLQTPYDIDPEMPLFAATSTGGLWSYRWRDRDNNKGYQWNAEE